jgi:hypothetical protein
MKKVNKTVPQALLDTTDAKFVQAVLKCHAERVAKGLSGITYDDAKKEYRFYVIGSHVNGAIPHDPQNCVLARSLRDSTEEPIEVSMGGNITRILFKDKGVVIRFKTPVGLTRALAHFDDTGRWEAPLGEYKLRVMPDCEKLLKNASKRRQERIKKYVKLERGSSLKVLNNQQSGTRTKHNGVHVSAKRHISILPSAAKLAKASKTRKSRNP